MFFSNGHNQYFVLFAERELCLAHLYFGELGAPQVGLDSQPELPPGPGLADQEVADRALNAIQRHLAEEIETN